MEMFDELCKKFFKLGIAELVIDIGLTEEESELFGMELMSAFTGATSDDEIPSKSN